MATNASGLLELKEIDCAEGRAMMPELQRRRDALTPA